MDTTSERILLVGENMEIEDLIARQALQPLGYQVQTAPDVNTAIMQVARFAPDLVIADLDMPGLSGKDLLVALNSQGLQIPAIVIARKGEEQKVIQAFRLGAGDYLLWPVSEAEVVAVVERVLQQINERRSRQRLDKRLKDTNQELGRRVRELTSLFAIGKAVISITDQRVLFDKIVEGVVSVAEADFAWLLLREEQNRTFLLSAHRNLPDPWAMKAGKQLDDGMSSLVAFSGETLAINGEPLKRFKVAFLGQSAVVVPVKIQQEVIGLLVVVRKADQPFDRNVQLLLEAITDYASVSLVNARLFRALQETAEAAQLGEKQKREQLQALRQEIQTGLQPQTYPLELLLSNKIGVLSPDQGQALKNIQDAIQRILTLVMVENHPETDGKK
jgi:two-component system, LuxR family, response regulator FixJ